MKKLYFYLILIFLSILNNKIQIRFTVTDFHKKNSARIQIAYAALSCTCLSRIIDALDLNLLLVSYREIPMI